MRLQVWGKGYRVSAESEEFQLLVPRAKSELSGLEVAADSAAWPRLLTGLYEMSEFDVENQRCILISHSEALLFSVARSTDSRSRTSVVAVVGAMTLDWEDPVLPDVIARAAGGTARIAKEYGRILAGGNQRVAAQLAGGTFVSGREFTVEKEVPDAAVDWPRLIGEIRRWQGINGVSTSQLFGLGANVLIGTEIEAASLRSTYGVDGVFDPGSRAIVPIGDRLRLWVRQGTLATLAGAPPDSKDAGQAADAPTAAPPLAVAPDSGGSLVERAVVHIESLLSEIAASLRELLRRPRDR